MQQYIIMPAIKLKKLNQDGKDMVNIQCATYEYFQTVSDVNQ